MYVLTVIFNFLTNFAPSNLSKVQIHFGLKDFHAHSPVVTIGTFDGVHIGHRGVINELCRIGHIVHGETVVFTFFPHPRVVVSPDEDSIRLLSSKEEKIELINELGVDHLVIYPFTEAFSKLSFTEFVEDILVAQIHINRLVVGYDHKFGHERKGDFQSLGILSQKHDFHVEKLDKLLVDDVAVSSTIIRNAIEAGDISKANQNLGYAYRLNGKVIQGNKLGRKIGFPTANIEPSERYKLIPNDGVYAVFVTFEGVRYKGMLNVGFRPTVNTNVDHRSIEVHLFNFNQIIYNKDITIHFIQKIRNEIKFADIEALKEQLIIDEKITNNILSVTI